MLLITNHLTLLTAKAFEIACMSVAASLLVKGALIKPSKIFATLLGGEPFLNTAVCLQVVRAVRATYGQKKDIWSWSGYTFEELLLESQDKLDLLAELDVLVDGRFDLSKRDLSLQFRGSSNQRILDVPASLKQKKAIIWSECIDANRH